MKKKLISAVLTGAMVAAGLTCAMPAMADGVSLRLCNGKVEVDAALKELAAKYKEETGVDVQIESIGGGVDIQSTLKGYYQADNMPDIFYCDNAANFAEWDGVAADLSDEAWVSDTDQAFVDTHGKVIGFPYTIEAIGLAYNADILNKAGIDPASITGPDALKSAFETLDSKKDELGLTAVVGYCVEPVNLWWSTGQHMFGVYEDAGLARDDSTYLDMLNDGGKIDKDRFGKYAEMVALFNQYSDPDLLISGTYDQQILNFASGKYAFVTQGSWIGATMVSNDKEAYDAAGDFKVGMVPYAFDDGIDTIQTNAPSHWAVTDNDNAEESKKFLQWCAGEEGQELLVKGAGFVSPFKSCTIVPDDPFAQTIADYSAAGKTSAWHWLGNKAGLAQNVLASVYQDYASGAIADAASFTDTIAQVCEAYYAE